MGSGLYEITCSIACSLARFTGWLSAVDKGGEKIDKGGEKVAPDEKTFVFRSSRSVRWWSEGERGRERGMGVVGGVGRTSERASDQTSYLIQDASH